MKQPFTILILLALLPLHSAAQQWATPGTEWHFVKWLAGDIVPNTVKVVEQFEMGGHLVSKLEVENQLGCGFLSSEILTYSSSDGKVYFKQPTEPDFRILYDFQAEVGDSWSIPFSNGNLNDVVTYTVEQVNMIEVEGSTRRQLFCTVSSEIHYVESPENVIIVEGVGDLHYLFPWQSAVCTEGYILGLCSYSDEVIGTYRPNPDLDCVTVSVQDRADHTFFSISPNPVNEELNIHIPESAPSMVPFTIFDLHGKVIHQAQINNHGVIQLSVSSWAPGHYIIRSLFGDHVKVGRFVKQ